MKHQNFCFVFALATVAPQMASAYAPPSSARATFNFNSNWRVNVGDTPGAETDGFNDAAWKTVTTPNAWNEDDAFRKSIDQLATGVVWNRKRFKMPASASGKKVFLEFEGIRHGGEFYLNGQFIGRHENGVMAFGFDISDKVRPAGQENVLAARIDNAWNYKEKATGSGYQWSDRNFYANYGGINKNVRLHVSDKLHQTLPLYSNLGTTGTYVYASDFNIPGKSAVVNVESQVKNDDSKSRTFGFQSVVEDADGRIVGTLNGPPTTLAAGQTGTVRVSGRLNNLKFWSWGYGALYNVYSILREGNTAIDVVKTRTGFRKTAFSDGALKLNDRTMQVHGYAQRTTNEWPALGIGVPSWMSDLSNGLMVEGNANLVRWMHVTPSKQDVESCDRVGLIQAMPAGDSERDVDGRRWELRVELMRDAIIYNRNNPSIIFYEAGNKGISEAHMSEMKAVRDQFDPHGGRAMGARDMLGSSVAEFGGEMLYINKSQTKPLWAMEYSRDEGLRKYWDEWSPPFHKEGAGPLHNGADASAYNHNQDAHARENIVRWLDFWRERPGTGARASGGGVNIIFSDSNTHHRGGSNFRASGEVDAMRLPKDGFFANQIMWDGWVNIERPRAHILGHWNYAPGTRKTVDVVSGAAKVELFLNGKSLGLGKRTNEFLTSFPNIEWQAGQLRAVGYDVTNKKVCEDARTTTGAPASIRLTPHFAPDGFKADGADIALVDVEVVDARGVRCPTALHSINFVLSGAATWRGGIAQGPDNLVLSKTLPVEAGVNRVMLRSTTQSGAITLSATSPGLKAATLALRSLPVPVFDGLSPVLSGALPSFLGRGPTPLGDSVSPTRQPLRIVSAAAGANAEQALFAFDDNEETTWTNDGVRATGWIQFELARAATVSQITMKLSGWRNKRYPIRVLVDGREAYRGSTPASLGYVTLALAPTAGKIVRIELTGASEDSNAFGTIRELSDPKNADTTGTGGNAKGSLNILETEIYGPVETRVAAK